MPVEELAMYFQQMVVALQHIHGNRILHRDIKADQCASVWPP